MASDIGGVLSQLNRNSQGIRDDSRSSRNEDAKKVGDSSIRRTQQVNDQIQLQTRTLSPVQNSTLEEAEAAIREDSRIVSLTGAVNTSVNLEELLDDASEIIEDLRGALRSGDHVVAEGFEREFYQTTDSFSKILQDGGRAGNNLLTSDISRLQVEVAGQEAPLVIEGRNILETVENGGVFAEQIFSNRGEFENTQLAGLLGVSNPVILAELPESVLLSLQSFVTNARDNVGALRTELTGNLDDLFQVLRTARVIQDSGEDYQIINEERANLLALQTRLQLEDTGGAVVEDRREEILQFFR